MTDEPFTVRVSDNTAKHRYEAHVGDTLAAYAVYELKADTVIFLHTQTEPPFEGHGVASRLAEGALDDARNRGLRVIALCPFFASYIDRHPAYADLVDSAT